MKFVNYSLKFLIVLCLITVAHVAHSASTNEMKVVRLKQGCSIICPKELRTLDSANIERIQKYSPDTADNLGPKLTFQPDGGMMILYIGVDNRTAPKVQVQLMLGPSEMSQADLKAFTPEQTKNLADVMFRRLRPVSAQVGVKMTKELDSKLLDGRHLKCFLLAYEFTDDTKVPQISLRTYYYTKSATFIVGFSCEKDYYDKNKDVVQMVLESLNSNGDL